MVHSSESDERLMAHFCAGVDEALAILYRRHEKPLLSFIYRAVLDIGIAEELLQETWVRVVRHRRRYRPDASFRTWIFRVATNLCRDWFRAQKHRNHISLHEPNVEMGMEWKDRLASPQPRPDTIAERHEMTEQVKEAIASLSSEQRLVVSLKWYQGMKLREIAEVMACPLGTVKSHDFRANQQLRRLLGKYVTDGKSDVS